jgi:hypothetical protein
MNPRSVRRLFLSVLGSALLVAGITLVLQLASCPTAVAAPAASTLFASSSGSGLYCSQSSPCRLGAAAGLAADGDLVYVAQGTYTANGDSVVELTSGITLYGGWNGATSGPVVRDPDLYITTLDGEYERRVVFASTSGITPTIDGFVITRGNASHAPYDQGKGGGIYIRYASVIISNNVISGNVAYTHASQLGYGGGVCVVDPAAGPLISGNLVYSNAASTAYEAHGGGIVIAGSGTSSAEIVENTVLSNTASITGGLGFGGGMLLQYADGAMVMTNTVEHNVAQKGLGSLHGATGGGIHCRHSDDVTIRNNLLQYNVASFPDNGSGGGIAADDCRVLAVISNTIRYNTGSNLPESGTGRGGGICVYYTPDVTIDRNHIVSNTAHYGGGLYLGRSTSFTMTNDVVAHNYAQHRGGGMAFEATSLLPVTGTLAHNTFFANNLGYGEGRYGIHANEDYLTLDLTNNIVSTHDYGVYAASGATVSMEHTLFYNNGSGDTGGPGTITNTNPITGQDPLLDSTYHLMDGSPAIRAGLTIGWPPLDIDALPRRLSDPDIGADQWEFPYKVYLPLVLRSY